MYNRSCYCSLAIEYPHVFDTNVILNIINRLFYELFFVKEAVS
jgi:hypothetical protein